MLKQKLGNLAGAAQTWNQLSILNKATGNLTAAERWYRKAIEDFREAGDTTSPSKCLSNLANLLKSQPGRLGEARELAEEALALDKMLDAGTAEIFTGFWRPTQALAAWTSRAAAR